MLAWDDLRYLLAVRRHGSVARAAKALGLNKSTIGRRIAALEEALGVSLVQRGEHRYELTSAGNAGANAAERIEGIIDEIVGNVGGADRVAKGVVRVTVPAWFAKAVIMPSIAAFREAHPGLDVHLLTTDEVLDLGRREADIGIRNARPKQQSLVVRKAGPIDFAMYASEKYIEQHSMPKSRADFAKHHLVGYQDAVAYVDAFRWTNELSDRVAFRATDATSMLDAVVAGIGIGVLPCFIAARTPGIAIVEPIGAPQPEIIWLVTHPDAAGVERIRVVSAWILELFKEKADFLARSRQKARR